MRIAELICVGILLTSHVTAAAQQCLHGPDETPEQQTRRTAALRATRQVNTLQANRPEARDGKFLGQTEMVAWYADQLAKKPASNPLVLDRAGEVIPGWQLTLDTTGKGYWFMIKDKTDPCGFAYVSNQDGLIYTAEVIR